MAKKAKKKPAKKAAKKSKPTKTAAKKAKPAKKAAKKKVAPKKAAKKTVTKKAAPKKSGVVKIAPPSKKSQPMVNQTKPSSTASFMTGLAAGAGAATAFSSFGHESKPSDDGEE